MKTKTFIHIAEACHENWNAMSAQEQGRFCQQCSKTVTDFSEMSDREVLQFLSSGKGSGCGRFAADQLNREIHLPATQAKRTAWAWLLSLCLPFVAALKVQGQKRSATPAKTEQVLTAKPAKTVSTIAAVTGEVSDTARLKNNNLEDSTALEGEMHFKPQVMGLIIEYKEVDRIDTVATVVKKATKNEMFKLYPNPAVKGKKLGITMQQAGDFSLQLLDMKSRMIMQHQVSVSAKGQVVFLALPGNISSGNYYIRMINSKTKKQFVDKLVVK